MKKLTAAEQSYKNFRDKITYALPYVKPIPTKCWGKHKPKRGSEFAAGIDLYNNGESISLMQGQTAVVNTQTAMAIPHGYVGLVFPRSGFGFKGLTLINGTGVIDSDYRGEILVKVVLGTDDGSKNINQMDIDNGTRFAQIVIVPVLMADIKLVDELDDTDRGAGGIGSSGTK